MKPMLFQGAVLNQAGEPIDGAAIQVWQADPNGNYAHPRSSASQPESPEFASIVDEFQYFGTAHSDSSGSFSFLTYRPGLYAVRPYSHFHFKIWTSDPGGSSEASGEIPRADLTTQFYFRDEKPPFPDELALDVVEVEYDVGGGGSYHYGSYVNGTIVLDDGGGEVMLPLSPSQAEGPFYPLDDFFASDNDLTSRGAAMEDGGEETEASSNPTSSPVLYTEEAEETPVEMPENDSLPPTASSSTAQVTKEPTEPPATSPTPDARGPTDTRTTASPVANPLSDAPSQQSNSEQDKIDLQGVTSESCLRNTRSATLLAIAIGVLFQLVCWC